MEFSEDIKQLLKDKFPDKDMYSMSKDELIQFREEVVELREEYNLLEQAMKSLGNAAYGAAANQYFYFFNVELAGDITGECRNLTKSMIRNLENFFHEEIWTRKDLQEKFDFELDESMHDWYREQPIWVYSDTDSVAADSKIIVKITNKNCSKQEIKEITFNDLYNTVKNKCYINKNSNGKEIISINDISVLNIVDNKPAFVPIKHLIRHKVSKAKYKIKTKSGKEIIVTNDHSCIVIRNGKQISIKAKDINIKTDKIISVINE